VIALLLGEWFFSSSQWVFFTANWVLFFPDSKIQKHTCDLFIIMTHTHTVMMVYFLSRPSTDKVHTVQMLSKDR
jgi:hypothetical protein